MVMTKPLIDLSQAQLTRDRSGTITIDDPDSPLLITIRCNSDTPVQISDITINSRHPTARITSAALARLPLTQICQIVSRANHHPNDSIWRMKITPKKTGSRVWDDDHWNQVLSVCEWATATKRQGGPAKAVADLWNVAQNPTAYRWIRKAKKLRDST